MFTMGTDYEREVSVWKEKDTGIILLEVSSLRAIQFTKNEAYIIGQELVRLGRGD